MEVRPSPPGEKAVLCACTQGRPTETMPHAHVTPGLTGTSSGKAGIVGEEEVGALPCCRDRASASCPPPPPKSSFPHLENTEAMGVENYSK